MTEQSTPEMLEAVKRFADGYATAVKQWEESNTRFRLFLASVGPSFHYALEGYPYGHHTRGKKKWTLEQKRRRQQ
jgi:hypothetical protein